MLSFLDFYNPAHLNLEVASAIIFYFMVYSLFGWLLENSYSKFTGRSFFKPNFFLGPFKPMYGFAPIILVYLISPDSNWMKVILLCFFIPTAIEYLTGVLLYKLFQQRWWDYRDLPLQFHGHICFPFSICWIVLSYLCIQWLHPQIVSFLDVIEPVWTWVWPAVGLYFLAELALAVRRHSITEIAAEHQ
ncbi:putative ABC transporter permease [Bacillus sp. MRMR6]|uniref:putative ABC transporter permease n=1 Tax=Bacillus sp. MRMR6 TaxID=1928617 RepID=UPI000951F298|nr:putative ABC transporter permease [Bacillus sp. MRMR6]OLS37854.1 hypothetical protein BTR25_15180 [Bacillus sp. MRMR6]